MSRRSSQLPLLSFRDSPYKRDMTSSKTVVALTGGIGSGKSQVARLFAEWGAEVVDADELARVVVEPGSLGLAKTAEAFGSEVLNANGTLNRSKLASVIFSDEVKRKRLEEILHPLIRQTWLSRLETFKASSPAAIIVYTLPLFFESTFEYPEIDCVVHVSAPEELRVKRVTARDGCSDESVRARMRAQLSDEEKNSRSDFIIANDGSMDDLVRRSRDVFESLVRGKC
jgi:dephospho-CoA kinase